MFSIQLLGAVACPLEKAVKEDRILEIMDFVETDYFLDKKKLKNENKKSISLKICLMKQLILITMRLNKFDLPKEDDLSEILFTTGTTGKSKGIKIVYRNNVAIAQNVSRSNWHNK